MVEATKWAQLTKVEQQIDNFVMRIHVLYIPSLYYHLTMCERQRQKINDCKFCIFYSFQLRKNRRQFFVHRRRQQKKEESSSQQKQDKYVNEKTHAFTHEEIACANRPMWPDLAIFHRSGKISLKNLAIIFSVQLTFGKILNLLWQWFITNGHIYIFVNGQILNK